MKYFKKQDRNNDLFKNVKKPRTAYSFFMCEVRRTIQETNSQLGFAEISKEIANR